MNKVNCIKLNKELEGLDRAPYPGELGKKILESVSKEAWQQWLDYQTMLINENNLNLFEESSQSCLLYTSPSPRDGLLSRMPSSA